MIGIIDYGMGNLLSVSSALEMCGAEPAIISNPDEVQDFDKIILPGVGAFGDCIKNLENKGFIAPLNIHTLTEQKPILGICLGMQVMATRGLEKGEFKGLGWIDAEVIKIETGQPSLKVPQIGWNNVDYVNKSVLFDGIKEGSDFYFVHSYFMNCAQPEDILATCDYGGKITAAVGKNNIYATQFHPEKSQDIGLDVLQNFLQI